jgi:hypothetical protein
MKVIYYPKEETIEQLSYGSSKAIKQKKQSLNSKIKMSNKKMKKKMSNKIFKQVKTNKETNISQI